MKKKVLYAHNTYTGSVYREDDVYLTVSSFEGKRLLFEGERDHLTPNTSWELLENHFFVIAGRIIGHSFLNGGPCLTGLSPAIIHILLEGSPETATISLSDCVDQEVRDVLTLVGIYLSLF